MHQFDSDGARLAYVDEPAGGGASAGASTPGTGTGARMGASTPVVLIHGFASNVAMNWTGPGWIEMLTGAGYRTIAFDNRGHGESEKLYSLEDYGAPLMAEDVARLLDHLGIERADIMGYSMGARIAAFFAIKHPDRVRSCIFGGLGINMIRPMAGTRPIAHALEAASIDDVTNPTARTFRAFAEQTGSDLKALAACIRSARDPITAAMLGGLGCPVLVAVGSNDVIGGDAASLAALIPKAESVTIAGRDHMRAVGDQQFKSAVLAFLQERP